MANKEQSNDTAKLVAIVDEDKNTNLHVLAARGDHEALALLDVGQKIDSQNFYGWTPLMVAARNGDLDTVKTLLDKRADATKVSKYGITPLMIAALKDDPQFSQNLIAHGADPHQRNAKNETAQDLANQRNGGHNLMIQPPVTGPTISPSVPSVIPAPPPMQYMVVGPQIVNNLGVPLSRKSSNTNTPEIITPNISPLGFYPQVFFPQDFTYGICCPVYGQEVLSPLYTIQSPLNTMHNMTMMHLNMSES